jgi:hypothetical protein
MSIKNGDKARFGRLRKQKILLRKRIREMREAMENKNRATIVASEQNGATPLTLDPVG